MATASTSSPPSVDTIDTSYLETLLGYNARRAALAIIEVFLQDMAQYDLRPVEFSVISLITHNPGITSRQICTALGLLPPNLVGLLNALEKRGLIERKPHPSDGRAVGLHPTPSCTEMMQAAEKPRHRSRYRPAASSLRPNARLCSACCKRSIADAAVTSALSQTA